MNPITSLLCLVLALPVALAAPGGQRLWKDSSGNTVSAQFLWADEEQLFLKLPNGKETTVELGRLSNDDLDFVRKFRAGLKAKGITFEAPLIWEEYRSKQMTPGAAAKLGAFPLDSGTQSRGTLTLEFRRFGARPPVGPEQRAVLRMRSADRKDAGTGSTVSIAYRGKTVGRGRNVPAATTFDIPLDPAIFNGTEKIQLTVTCGPDTVYLRTHESGAGPRLLIVEQKPE